jgi:putative endonuclease
LATIFHGPVVQRIEYLPAGAEGIPLGQAGKFPKTPTMWFVYAIKSKRDERIYVGICLHVPNRIDQHNKGKTKSTKGYRPWVLIYQEQLPSRAEARTREKYLKSGAGKEFLKNLVP